MAKITLRPLLALVAAACLTPVVAFAAKTIAPVEAPPMSLCSGEHLWLAEPDDGQMAPAGGFSIEVFGPRGGKVWEKRWGPRERVRWWPHAYKPGRPGLYSVVFRSGRKSEEFEVRVVDCRPGVRMTLNDRGAAMLDLAKAKPGSSDVSCIVVTYAGDRPALVRLHGRTRGTLDRYLGLTVVRGRLRGHGFDRCEGFKPDRANYVGAGRGVVYRGTLRAFADRYAAAPADPPGRFARAWQPGESHAYKFVVRLKDTNQAQGRRATQTFTWEARAKPAGRP